jgi:hypothetical protein
MHLLLSLLLAAAFWETKNPGAWTKAELLSMFRTAPWVQRMETLDPVGGEQEIFAYLATARPMLDAEAELTGRSARSADELAQEYRTWLQENGGKVIVLAVELPKSEALQDGAELAQMQKESFMMIGRKKHKMSMYFPPSSTDPHLRFVFPRVIRPEDKVLSFEIYVPGVMGPLRRVEFKVKDLAYKGQPEM